MSPKDRTWLEHGQNMDTTACMKIQNFVPPKIAQPGPEQDADTVLVVRLTDSPEDSANEQKRDIGLGRGLEDRSNQERGACYDHGAASKGRQTLQNLCQVKTKHLAVICFHLPFTPPVLSEIGGSN